MLRCRLQESYRMLVCLFSGLFIASLLGACAPLDVDVSTVEENISLERARSLAPFALCFPSQLPPGAQPVPLLTYRDRQYPSGTLEWAAIDAEYLGAEGNRVMKLRQSYVPLVYGHPSDTLKGLVRELVAWQVGPEWDKVRAIEPSVVWRGSTYHEGRLTYDAVEISLPAHLRGSLVTWWRGDVSYELYSLFPLTTTLGVARAVSDCEAGNSW
jgi:hypothetical protein